jgi:ornithine carbamoyltransferase
MTFEEHRGPVRGRTFAWTGDGNNVLVSLIEGAVRFGFKLRAATPAKMKPPQAVLDWARQEGGDVEWMEDPRAAVEKADCIVTDTWVSMSDSHEEAASRMTRLEPYRVDAKLMALAASDALFMHCLPAHIGEEVTQDVFEGPHSVVFDEAENRLHAQKGILAWTMGGANWTSFGKE